MQGCNLRHCDARAEMPHVLENPEDCCFYMCECGINRFYADFEQLAILTIMQFGTAQP